MSSHFIRFVKLIEIYGIIAIVENKFQFFLLIMYKEIPDFHAELIYDLCFGFK